MENNKETRQDGVVSFLHDRNGRRKYLTPAERQRFLIVAHDLVDAELRSFCLTLAHTGARLSEVLNLTMDQVDLESQTLIIEGLKKRRRHVYRAVPIPPSLLRALEESHDFTRTKPNPGAADQRLWPWGRTTGWQKVKLVMTAAEIAGPQACPKGLRHGFAVAALLAAVPLTLVSKWLGHSSLKTTAVYTEIVGAEERFFAEKLWREDGDNPANPGHRR